MLKIGRVFKKSSVLKKENVYKSIKSLSSSLFILLLLSVLPAISSADTWTLGTGKGACFAGDSRVGNPKYCHNCQGRGGDNVKWEFKVLCNGEHAGDIEVSMPCGHRIPDEGDQLRSLQDSARQSIPSEATACPG